MFARGATQLTTSSIAALLTLYSFLIFFTVNQCIIENIKLVRFCYLVIFISTLLFTARCTLVQSAVLWSHVVCLSVTLVNCDHIGWNSSKIISPLVSPGCSLFATPTWRVCSKGNTPKFGPKWPTPVDLSVGDIRSQIAAEWLQIAQRSQWRAYRKLPSIFLMVPSLTPYDIPFPQNGGSICPQHTRMAISLQRVIRSTSCLVLG